MLKEFKISIITCVNNWDIYNKYFLKSFKSSNSDTNIEYELIAKDNTKSPQPIAKILNSAIKETKYNITAILHQDVIFTNNWLKKVASNITSIKDKWGVIGIVGINKKGQTSGNLINPDDTKFCKNNKIMCVQTLDEVCLILNKENNLLFDDIVYTGFHFYGADLCLQSIEKGYKNFTIDAQLKHLSDGTYDKEHKKWLKVFANKWKKYPLIRTTTMLKYYNLSNSVKETRYFFNNSYFLYDFIYTFRKDITGILLSILYLAINNLEYFIPYLLFIWLTFLYISLMSLKNKKLNVYFKIITQILLALYLYISFLYISWFIINILLIIFTFKYITKLIFSRIKN